MLHLYFKPFTLDIRTPVFWHGETPEWFEVSVTREDTILDKNGKPYYQIILFLDTDERFKSVPLSRAPSDKNFSKEEYKIRLQEYEYIQQKSFYANKSYHYKLHKTTVEKLIVEIAELSRCSS